MKQLLKQIRNRFLSDLSHDMEHLKFQNGLLLAEQFSSKKLEKITDAEFKVFSQWGQDGIIQYLIRECGIEERLFIEFGVQNYTESNTRFLLMKDNWSGIVYDGSQDDIHYIQNDSIYWKHDLMAQCQFIDAETIDRLLNDAVGGKEVGLLSVDIDGNDYWVWKAINSIQPKIIICEYNSSFGSHLAVTVPYDRTFQRTKAHYSNLYFGASLKALVLLAQEKGYRFVGCNQHGNDAFFIREDIECDVRTLSVQEGFIAAKSRESRNEAGELTYLKGREKIKQIQEMKLLDIEQNVEFSIAERLNDFC